MRIEVDCPKCGETMTVRSERTDHDAVYVELVCPRCLYREDVMRARREGASCST